MSVTARAFDSLSARESRHSANEAGTMLEDSHRNDRNHQSAIGYERGSTSLYALAVRVSQFVLTAIFSTATVMSEQLPRAKKPHRRYPLHSLSPHSRGFWLPVILRRPTDAIESHPCSL